MAQSLPVAAEENNTLGTEFAKRLQAADDTGEIDMDAPEMQDADWCVVEHPSLSVSKS